MRGGTPGDPSAPQGRSETIFDRFSWILSGPGEALGHRWAHFSAPGRSQSGLESQKVMQKAGPCGGSVPGTIFGAFRDGPGPPKCGFRVGGVTIFTLEHSRHFSSKMSPFGPLATFGHHWAAWSRFFELLSAYNVPLDFRRNFSVFPGPRRGGGRHEPRYLGRW